jgi:putative membrane protein
MATHHVGCRCNIGGGLRPDQWGRRRGQARQRQRHTVAKHYEGPKPEGVSSPNDAVATTFYIPQAAISDMYEIKAAKIALVRGRAREVKAFAQMMLTDHQKSSARLRAFVADNPVNIAIPHNIDPRRSAMLANLQNATAQEFDTVYV